MEQSYKLTKLSNLCTYVVRIYLSMEKVSWKENEAFKETMLAFFFYLFSYFLHSERDRQVMTGWALRPFALTSFKESH